MFHHEDVAKHSGNIHGASLFGVRVLGVDAFEENALAVDEDKTVFDFDVAETIFGVEHHFFLTFVVLLCYDNIVEIRRFRRPRFEISQTIERHFCFIRCSSSRVIHGGSSRFHHLVVGIEQSHLDLLCTTEFVTVVEFKTHFHLPTGVGF